MKFIKKPVTVEAVKWTGTNEEEIKKFVGLNAIFQYYVTKDNKNLVTSEKPSEEHTTSLKINTLEGKMQATVGDYIIKGIHGEFYPCKPDIFVKTYSEYSDTLDFGKAISLLKQGRAIRRKGWNGKGLFVIKQVPAHIDSNIIPKMQSLPQSAKDLIMKGKGFIDYTSQCLIYNENTGRADSWVPSISDVFAEDWELVL